jgi:amino acid transporter
MFSICRVLSRRAELPIVKQQIARQCFLPFYKFFARSDRHFGTPLGALILHWVATTIWVSATPNTSGGYGFVIGIFIYGQLIIGGRFSWFININWKYLHDQS